MYNYSIAQLAAFRVGEYNASEMEDVTSLYQTLEKTSKSHFDANVIVNCNSE